MNDLQLEVRKEKDNTICTERQKILLANISENASSLPKYLQGVLYGMAMAMDLNNSESGKSSYSDRDIN